MARIVIKGELDVVDVFAAHSLGKAPKSGTHTTVAAYKDGSYIAFQCHGCQACLDEMFQGGYGGYDTSGRHLPISKITTIYSSLWKRDDQDYEDAHAYWKFMMNPRWSPYRSVLKGAEIIYHEDKPIAYVLRDMAQSPQTIANLAFALRMPYAQDGYLRMFTALRGAGFTNAESSFVTANCRLTPKGAIGFPYIGDYPFDTCWADMSWSAWKEGKPKTRGQTILEGDTTYRPCNVIWSAGKAPAASCNYGVAGRKPTIIQKLLSGEFKYTGSFKKNFDSITSTVPLGAVGFEKAVKILQDNKTDWQVG
jgi:hypothetical protein